MQKTLLTSNLWNTTECKIDALDTLTITKLNLSGEKTKSHSLYNLEFTEEFSKPRIVNSLALFMAAFLIAFSFINYQAIEPISNILISIILSFYGLLTASLFLISPNKFSVYSDTFSNKKILKIETDPKSTLTNSFVHTLNSAIDDSKNKDPELDSIRSNTRTEYETNIINVNKLFNSGMIDEALYTRVNSSMRESVFGRKNNDVNRDNIVYINR